ncbi:MAG: 23S rRNA (adenine(2503)-C(2))-methyltransferase RlmN, partial [Oscillospiraceae bacterium]|nr:23S rRNA (adenine(2503)-C(2))-methyltransferase RlmN [Oscillospiraceae bacterium]
MNIKSMTLTELAQVFKDLGQPAFRAKQVYTWLHKGVRSYEEMTNLPKTLRDTLAEQYPFVTPVAVRKQESQKDGTMKFLWELEDGNCVETVLMRYHYGNTVCISTEVGCRMGCAFCASTLGGLVRKLEPHEMLDQVLFTQVISGLPVSHIVLMGIGEPLDNYDNVMRFLELVNSKDGMNIS